ncbi:Hpt domain-containing protein [bacterium]|nr:Hpt domain-containing protein [bacterium]
MDEHSTTRITVHIDPELADLIPGFLENRRKDIETVRERLAENDFETILLLGHSMKGNGAGYGFDELTEIGREMEQAARDKQPDAIRKTLADLVAYLENLDVVFD